MSEFVVPRLEKFNSQPEIQKLLLGLTRSQSVQTFLWTGPEGVGKKSHALALTRSLFCPVGPECSGCPTCKQVLSKSHPDLFWVDQEHFWADEADERKKSEITVKVVRHLSEKLNQAPFSAPLKVAIIPNAQDMNDLAQDTFLKTLEEPPARSLIILIADKTGDFRPTVLSRCRMIRFSTLSDSKVEALLSGFYGRDKDEAKKAAQEAGGNLSAALRAGDKEWGLFREKVCADFDHALSGSVEGWLRVSSEYDKLEPDFLGDKERTASQRKAEVLNAAFQVYSGLWSARLEGNADIPKKMSSLSPGVVLNCLQKHRDMIPTNLNAKMILDHLFLELLEGFEKGELANRPIVEHSLQI